MDQMNRAHRHWDPHERVTSRSFPRLKCPCSAPGGSWSRRLGSRFASTFRRSPRPYIVATNYQIRLPSTLTKHMTQNDLGEQLWQSLETHETEIKHAVQSLGDLETELKDTAEQFEGESAVLTRLEAVGCALEEHELHLENVIETLDHHKGVIRKADNIGTEELQQAMEHARRKARQEARPSRQGASDGREEDNADANPGA